MRSTLSRSFVVLCFIVSLAGCDNPDFTGPLASRQPSPPSGTSARPLNSHTIQVTWTDSSPNEIGFRVERAPTATGPWVTAGTTNKNISSFDDTGRPSEQQSCYRVIALRQNGATAISNTSCTVPPAGATGLTAAAVDHQTIDLAWTDNSAVEAGYEIERAIAQAGPYSTVAFVPSNTTTYRQSGLTTGTTYWYRVRPNKDGGYGDYSNLSSATPRFTVPNAPSGLSVMPVYGSYLELSWVDNSMNETAFRIERSLDAGATWTFLQNASPNFPYGQDYGVAPDHEACYRVFAFNAQGDSPPSNMDCSAVPLAPTDLVASVAGDAIDLTWSDNSVAEDGYQLWRDPGDGSGYQRIATLAANSTTYRDHAATPDVLYRYYVFAQRDGGTSQASNIASGVIATTPPAAPTAVAASPSWSSTIVGITWTDNSANEQGFRVERSIDGGARWVTAGTTDGYYGNWFYDGDLASEQQVCYQVFAFNAVGDSPASPIACTAPPAAPTDLVATLASDGQTVDLAWTDNSAVEDGYEVWADDGYGDWYSIVSLGPNATNFRYEGDPFAYSYGFAVVAVKDGGYSDYSNFAYPTSPSGTASVRTRSLSRVPTPRRPVRMGAKP